ncbi:helix-turn-helix domain-containing protein [Salininema proteolyticum]|uniref:Helix-turn-helix domain-containing protein n=1 Tax=Salininema proteolyticum TaxID=1607685 RepID=A0ABV8TXE0_9ACTN
MIVRMGKVLNGGEMLTSVVEGLAPSDYDWGVSGVEYREKFAQWVDGVVVALQNEHHLSIAEIASQAGISYPQLNRWRRGNFDKAPHQHKLRQFCRGLGLDPSEPFAILGFAAPTGNPDGEEPAGEMNPFDGTSLDEIRATIRRLQYILQDPHLVGGERKSMVDLLNHAVAQYEALLRKDDRFVNDVSRVKSA